LKDFYATGATGIDEDDTVTVVSTLDNRAIVFNVNAMNEFNSVDEFNEVLMLNFLFKYTKILRKKFHTVTSQY